MRLFTLGVIFFLVLSLGNSLILHREEQVPHANDSTVFHIGQRFVHKWEWDAFIWGEIAALGITLLVFGALASIDRARSNRQP